MLKSILFPEKFAATSLYVQPDYPRIHAELALPGVNMTLLWMEYSKRCEAEGTTPYMYTQLKREVPAVGAHHESDDAYPS